MIADERTADKVMTNANGTIGCHGFKGTATDARPDPTTKVKVANHTVVPSL